jgi:hypothetical protein
MALAFDDMYEFYFICTELCYIATKLYFIEKPFYSGVEETEALIDSR